MKASMTRVGKHFYISHPIGQKLIAWLLGSFPQAFLNDCEAGNFQQAFLNDCKVG
jgi:hypothetical protein